MNRHNYEEFFLLYIDRELEGEARAMVEAFVAANPDLKEELGLLQQTRLVPEGELEPGFLLQLLKPEEVTIHADQELLLRSVDDELSADAQLQLAEVLRHNPALQQELNWLHKSKLQADLNIAFPDKASLYKKEQQPGLVVSFNKFTRRFAAAASVALLLGTGWWLFFRDQPAKPDTVNTSVPISGAEQTPTAAPATHTPETNSSSAKSNSNVATVTNTTALQTAAAGGPPSVAVRGGDNSTNSSGQTSAVANPSTQPESLVVQATTEMPEKNSEPTSNIPTTSTVPTVTNTASNVSFASYNNTEATEDENEGFLNEHQQRRSGIKGFFKKAKRTLERRTGISSGESEVRFAVFAIGTK